MSSSCLYFSNRVRNEAIFNNGGNNGNNGNEEERRLQQFQALYIIFVIIIITTGIGIRREDRQSYYQGIPTTLTGRWGEGQPEDAYEDDSHSFIIPSRHHPISRDEVPGKQAMQSKGVERQCCRKKRGEL